ncbi:MAG TPA: MBL fold metallo-hydrolase [Candidatus Anoxymicrobiaceae bacterium]
MNIETFTDLSFGTNTYLVWNEGSKDALLIDAGLATRMILEFLKKEELQLEAILITHAHPDHIAGAADLAEATGADVYLHEIEIQALDMMPQAMLAMLGIEDLRKPTDMKPLSGGQTLELAGLEIKVLHTPGHSPGSTSFLIDSALFDGDLVFRGSIGRTDFPGGDFEALMNSVREHVFVLDPETKVYPGHMGATTVGLERRTNPFLAGQ